MKTVIAKKKKKMTFAQLKAKLPALKKNQPSIASTNKHPFDSAVSKGHRMGRCRARRRVVVLVVDCD